MDLEKHLLEAKTLAAEEQQLKDDLAAQRMELAIEEQNLEILRARESRAIEELETAIKFRDFKRALLNNFEQDRGRLNRIDLQRSLLKTCLNKMAPTAEIQVQRYQELEAEHKKLMRLYEEQPIYLQILQEKAKQTALEERIQELRESLKEPEQV